MSPTKRAEEAEYGEFYREVKDAAQELQDFVVEQMDKRPYAALGTATAIGYALGLPRGALALLTGLGSRLAWGWVESLLEEAPSARSARSAPRRRPRTRR